MSGGTSLGGTLYTMTTCPDPPENVFFGGRGQLKVKQGVKESGDCVNISPAGGARQRMSSDILYTTTSDTTLTQISSDFTSNYCTLFQL